MSTNPIKDEGLDSVKQNLLGLDLTALRGFFGGIGEKPFRAQQLMQWIYQYGQADFSAMTNLSKTLRKKLTETAVIELPEVIHEQLAADGTRKWLIRLRDGNCIETVFIPEDGRGTLCVSSQVGCVLNCRFCSTAAQGFNRNLDTSEIIAQVWLAQAALGKEPKTDRIITNIVMMGMGEPMANFDNVVSAIRIMLDDMGYGFSHRRVTLSTSGIVPMIDRLREICHVSLAVSLHATNNELRTNLVPINKKYPLAELLAACKRYVAGIPRQKITFEYVMLAGVNDSLEHAYELINILCGIPAKVNLIPFNQFPGSQYHCPDPETISRFRDVLLKSGLMTITRKTRGDEIDAACGQLAGRFNDRTRRTDKLQTTLATK